MQLPVFSFAFQLLLLLIIVVDSVLCYNYAFLHCFGIAETDT